MMSKTGTLAIRALMTLADLPDESYAGAMQIAKQLNAPANYLSKLLQSLSRAGILESQKGMGGGFRLIKSPDKITLYEIIEPVEQVSRWGRCIMGKATCSNNHPCALHHKWADISNRYLNLLENTTLFDLKNNKENNKTYNTKGR